MEIYTANDTSKGIGEILYASLAFVNGLIKMIYYQRKIKMKNKETNFKYGKI